MELWGIPGNYKAKRRPVWGRAGSRGDASLWARDTGLERPVGAAEAEKAPGLHAAWGPCAWRCSRDQRPAPVTETSSRPRRRPPARPLGQTAWLPAALGSRLTVLGQACLSPRTCVGAGGAATFSETLTLIQVRGLRRDLQRGSCRPKSDRFTPVPGERTQQSC